MHRFALLLVAVAVLLAGAACRRAPAQGATPANAASAQSTAAAAPASPQPPRPMPAALPDVLARVNGAAVTRIDFDRLVKNVELSNGAPIPADQRDRVLRDLLDQLVTYTVLQQEARTRSIDVTDAEVEARVQEMQGSNPQSFQKALADRSMTVEQLRSDARVDMVISKMLEAEVATLPGPSDAQAREFYDRNPDKFTQPESVRVSHVMVLVDPGADPATRQTARRKIEAVLARARTGADFAALARENSQDASARQGGELGYITRGQLPPPFEEAAFALGPGQISGVVTSDAGYHVLKVLDRKAASTVAFDQVSGRIKEYLTRQSREERQKAFVDRLKSKAKIEVLV